VRESGPADTPSTERQKASGRTKSKGAAATTASKGGRKPEKSKREPSELVRLQRRLKKAKEAAANHIHGATGADGCWVCLQWDFGEFSEPCEEGAALDEAAKAAGLDVERYTQSKKAEVATMPRTDRIRLDHMPCPAAVAALEAAQAMHPNASAQALLDRLVITGFCALVQEH
jgi:hypothetical protein